MQRSTPNSPSAPPATVAKPPRRRADLAGWTCALLFVVGCTPAAPRTPAAEHTASAPRATVELHWDVSPAVAQSDVRYDNGTAAGLNSIVESLGGGVGVLDYDRDGRLDLCFPGGGRFAERRTEGLPTRLLRQLGRDEFTDVGAASGIAAPRHFSHGCTISDYDHDGFADVLITGYGGLALWRNQGDGTFRETAHAAGLVDERWSSSAGWADLTGDGILDLYVAHYVNWSFDNNPPCGGPSGDADVCPPRQFDGLDDTLYFGNGDGTFRDASAEAGLVPQGKGLGVILADLDLDADVDIYVANDTTPNFFYVNDGAGRFQEQAALAGVAVDDMANPNGSMGVTLLDYDGDGWPDIWVTNYEDELMALYRNLQQAQFLHVSRKTGINRIGTLYVGFGCLSGDFDADGDEDVAIANGHVVHHPRNAPVRQQPLLMLNDGHGAFARFDPAPDSYFAGAALGRGLAAADLDDDGALDLVFCPTGEPAALLYNRSARADGTTGRPLQLRLVGVRSTREPLGAWAALVTNAGRRVRQLVGGGSYLSTSDRVLHWGVPAGETVAALEVHWPTGRSVTYTAAELALDARAPVWRVVLIEPPAVE